MAAARGPAATAPRSRPAPRAWQAVAEPWADPDGLACAVPAGLGAALGKSAAAATERGHGGLAAVLCALGAGLGQLAWKEPKQLLADAGPRQKTLSDLLDGDGLGVAERCTLAAARALSPTFFLRTRLVVCS